MPSKEVDDAVGEAPARTKGRHTNTTEPSLEQRAAELRRIVEQPSEKDRAAAELAHIERQMAENRDAQGRGAAEDRLLGIRRAYGSVTASLDADEKRVREKLAELADAITRLNDRYEQVTLLKAEAAALCDRFGLPSPALPNVVPPARRALELAPTVALLDHAQTWRPVEECEHHVRTRRTYEEISGTEGYAIIASVGPQPFPALTARQQKLVEERVREAAEMHRQLAGLPKIPATVPFSTGTL